MNTKDYFAFVKWGPKEIERDYSYTSSEVKRLLTVVEKSKNGREFLRQFDAVFVVLWEAYGKLFSLKSIAKDKKTRDSAGNYLIKIESFKDEIFQKSHLYDCLNSYKKEIATWNKEEQFVYEKYVFDFKQRGAHLDKSIQQKLFKKRKALETLKTAFESRLANNVPKIHVSEISLKDLPELIRGQYKKTSKGYEISTIPSLMGPFISYSQDVKNVKKIIDLNVTKGGKQNELRLKKTVILRKEIATLLGEKDFATYQLRGRLIGTMKEVNEFMKKADQLLQGGIKEEIQAIEQMFPSVKLDRYNLARFGRLYYEAKKGYESKELKPYFPLDNVLKVLPSFVKEITGATMRLVDSVGEGQYLASFTKNKRTSYLMMDLFPRAGKYNHACAEHVGYVDRSNLAKGTLGIVICNFTPSTKKLPSLLTPGELETFLHELGHAFHVMLGVHSFNRSRPFEVPLDFVEIPSQFIEQFIFDPVWLTKFSKHFETGKKIPPHYVDKFIAARNYGMKSAWEGGMVYAKFDLGVHTKDIKDYGKYSRDLVIACRGKRFVSPKLSIGSILAHIMGGYEVGYHSYLVSLIYSLVLYKMVETKKIAPSKVIELIFEKANTLPAQKQIDLLIPGNLNFLSVKDNFK